MIQPAPAVATGGSSVQASPQKQELEMANSTPPQVLQPQMPTQQQLQPQMHPQQLSQQQPMWPPNMTPPQSQTSLPGAASPQGYKVVQPAGAAQHMGRPGMPLQSPGSGPLHPQMNPAVPGSGRLHPQMNPQCQGLGPCIHR